MYIIRNARLKDLKQIRLLAKHLNTLNLPDDPKALEAVLKRSEASFHGAIKNPSKREFLFVLEDTKRKKVMGTSMIIAQHGTREAPHIYFSVMRQEHYSDTLDKWFVHKVLSLGYNFDGPTEVGGLILLPKLRGHPDRLGLQLSFVRFLFIAMHRDFFRDRVLAELLPPLEKGGKSLLWEALGKRFTGLTYTQADMFSRNNKEFVQNLFPRSLIYTTLFDPKAQAVIGVVGEKTRGVQRMLERIGFEYAHRIDPFDGGPHYEAATDDVDPIRDARKLTYMRGREGIGPYPRKGLVAMEPRKRNDRFRCIISAYGVDGSYIHIPASSAKVLGVEHEDVVWVTPLERE